MRIRTITDLPAKNKRNTRILVIVLIFIGALLYFIFPKLQNVAKGCCAVALIMYIFMRFLTTRTEIWETCAVSKTILRNRHFYLSEITNTQLFAGGSRIVVYGAGNRWLCEAMSNFTEYEAFLRSVKDKSGKYAAEPVPTHLARRGKIEGTLRITVIVMAVLAIMGILTDAEYKFFLVAGFVVSILAKWILEEKELSNDEKNLKQYGRKIEASLIGYMDETDGWAYPVFEFEDRMGKHMVMGLRSVEMCEMQVGEQATILYAPEKVAAVCRFE